MALNTFDELGITRTPELIFGLVGPIGVNMELVQQKLESALISVGYKPVSIKATEQMLKIKTDIVLASEKNPRDYYQSRMDYANKVREKCENDAALAALSILAIKNYRAEFHRKNESNDDEKDISGIAPIDLSLIHI